MPSKFKESLHRAATLAGLALDARCIEQCARYYLLLVEENKKINLTSITDPVQAAEKHFLDSLLLLDDLDQQKSLKVIDVGSGAGFPGLPLKICRPDLDMVLLDSVGKKTMFMEKVIHNLGLQHVVAVHARAEEHATRHRERYDTAVSRAVAETRVLVELTLPLVRLGGRVVIAKGPGVREELAEAVRAIDILGGTVEQVREFALPLSGDQRAVVSIKKARPTPGKYPRRPGMPGKKPL